MIISYGTCILSFKLIGLQVHQKLSWSKTLTWSGTDGRMDEQTDERMDWRTDVQTRKHNGPLLS